MCAFAFRRLFGVDLFLEEVVLRSFLNLGVDKVHRNMAGRELQMYDVENDHKRMLVP